MENKLSLKTMAVLADTYIERLDQDEKWGEQNHPDGTGPSKDSPASTATFDLCVFYAKAECEAQARAGNLTWTSILLEEVYEALTETDPEKLRKELVQVAAVATAWIENLDRKAEAH
jgi:hypothetical protein